MTLNAFAAEKIKIVSSLPRTGSANGQTNSVVNGIKMALEEVKYSVEGFELSYEDMDDASAERGAWDPSLEAKNADKAINDPSVIAFIGPYNSGAAKISLPKLNKARLLQITPGASWPGLTKPKTGEANEPQVYRPSGSINFFRVIPADDIQGKVAARWSKELGSTKVFILNDRELYGKGIAGIYAKEAKLIGLSVLAEEGIDIKASNYKALSTKIKQQNPDLVFYGGTTQSNAGQLIKDLRASGFKGKFMVPDGCFEGAFLDAAGKDNLFETYITFLGLPASELQGEGKKFYENYKAKYNSEPEAYAVYGYEAAKVVIAALKTAKSKDREALIQAVKTFKDFQGVVGTYSFDDNGDTSITTLSGNTVENGAFKFLKILK